MRTAIWKFLALSGVIALGCFVVYQVHTRIPLDGPPPASPADFTAVAGNDAESGTDQPASDQDAPDFFERQTEPQDDVDPAMADDPHPWGAVPAQDEPTPASAPELVASDLFGPPDPETPATDAPHAAPGLRSGPDAGPDAASAIPWLTNEPAESASAADVAAVDDGAPRTLPRAGQMRPLDGAFLPDDTDWANDPPAEAASSPPIADADLLPADRVDGLPAEDPFARNSMPAEQVAPRPESGDLPLVEFAADSTQESGTAPIDPFSGFSGESSSTAPVLPAAPRDAGFAESVPLATMPTVASNPFDFPPQGEDDPMDEVDQPVLPPRPDADPLPQLPPLAGDPLLVGVPEADEADDSPPPAMRPLPEFDQDDDSTERPLPDLAAPASESPSNPFTTADTKENSPPVDPFGSMGRDPEPVPTAGRMIDAGTASTGGLDLVGDATIDGRSASGPQQPELEIEKIAPPEATVGSPLIYAIRIRNVGSSAAHSVVVEDRIPRGSTLDGTIPQAELRDKVLTWRMGTIQPGEEQTIRIRVVPTEAGEIGSVATVRFAAEVSAATNITAAELRLEMEGPREITLGETAVFRYRLTNTGSGPARGAYIRCVLPPALEHPGGTDIEYEVGDLPPGGSSEVELPVRAAEAGTHLSRVFLNAGGRTHDESELTVKVLPSRLLISREGPARRFVGRRADYTTTVTNRSGAELTGISVVEQLPEALELASIPADGAWDPRDRTITWTIPRLAPGASFTIDSTIVAREYGRHSSSIVARDASGNEARVASDLEAAGFSTLEVDWEHDGGPVAVGEQVALRLTIRNQGTAPAEHVEAVFEVPPEMEFVNARGPVPFAQEGRLIRFDHVDTLAIDGEQSFEIILTAAAPGNTRVSAQLRTADHAEPLRHDEPVFILADEN